LVTLPTPRRKIEVFDPPPLVTLIAGTCLVMSCALVTPRCIRSLPETASIAMAAFWIFRLALGRHHDFTEAGLPLFRCVAVVG
jgi:hypothetical protein